MAKSKEEESVQQERRDLEDALNNKLVRDLLWTHVIEPSHVLEKFESLDPVANAAFLARENLAKDLIENIKDANLEAWFQMIRDNQFEEENDKDDEGNEE